MSVKVRFALVFCVLLLVLVDCCQASGGQDGDEGFSEYLHYKNRWVIFTHYGLSQLHCCRQSQESSHDERSKVIFVILTIYIM